MTLSIIKGKTNPSPRRVIAGPPGVGKSSFACAEPRVIAIDNEDGLHHIGVDRVVGADNWLASLALVREACEGPGDHLGVVVDTIDKLEGQAAKYICAKGIDGKRKDTLADYGYQDGFKALAQVWRELLFALEGARAKGRSVTLVSHVQRVKVNDPTIGEYSEWIAAIHKDCWSTTHQWADAVLFAQYEQGLVEGRAIMTGNRILHTQAITGFRAKHRPNIAPVLPLSWEAYAAAVSASQRTAEEVLESIRTMALVADEETQAKAEGFIEKAAGDVLQLAKVEAAMRKKVTEVRA